MKTIIRLSFISYLKVYFLSGLTAGIFCGFVSFMFGVFGEEISAFFGNFRFEGFPAGVYHFIMLPVGFSLVMVSFAVVMYPFFYLAVKIIDRFEEKIIARLGDEQDEGKDNNQAD